MSDTVVLICEDNRDLREALVTALTDSGFKILTATTGTEAVLQALTHHPDIILMDIQMPEMNGHDAVTKIRQDIWGKNAKVIFLTAQSDAESVSKAVSAGSEEYIIKDHTSLEEIVNKIKLVRHT